MKLDRVGPGKNVPDEINTNIEPPAHSNPVKHAGEKETSAIHYPCTMAISPHSVRSLDPRGISVVITIPLISGSVIVCRVDGV